MSIPVRSVRRWTPVLVRQGLWQESSKLLRHIETQFSVKPVSGCSSSGQVLWSAEIGHAPVGVAWRWGKRLDGIIVLVDPMTVASNLALLDDESGEPLSALQHMCSLCCAIYSLPWQTRL